MIYDEIWQECVEALISVDLCVFVVKKIKL